MNQERKSMAKFICKTKQKKSRKKSALRDLRQHQQEPTDWFSITRPHCQATNKGLRYREKKKKNRSRVETVGRGFHLIRIENYRFIQSDASHAARNKSFLSESGISIGLGIWFCYPHAHQPLSWTILVSTSFVFPSSRSQPSSCGMAVCESRS